jgi:predicted glutamine amidotransferase
MCGLIASFKKKGQSSVKEVYEMYQEQYSRGQEGFGMISIGKDKKVSINRSCEGVGALYSLMTNKAPIILFHHRYPTSTLNRLQQTHPIYVSNKSLKFDWYVMHNGVITNTAELHKKHTDAGFKYTTEIPEHAKYNSKFNDSESLAVEIAMHFEGIQPERIDTLGQAAFFAVSVNKKTKKAHQVFVGKNTQTLTAKIAKDSVAFASINLESNFPENTFVSAYVSDLLTKGNGFTEPKNVEFKKYVPPPIVVPPPTPYQGAAYTHKHPPLPPKVTQPSIGFVDTNKLSVMQSYPDGVDGALLITPAMEKVYETIENKLIRSVSASMQDMMYQMAVARNFELREIAEETLDLIYQMVDEKINSIITARTYDGDYQRILGEKGFTDFDASDLEDSDWALNEKREATERELEEIDAINEYALSQLA